MAVVARHHSTIAVVHGRDINPVLILSLTAGTGALAMMIGWTATAPPSSSSSATGRSSWSCVHNPLKLPCGVPTCQTSEKVPSRGLFLIPYLLGTHSLSAGEGFAIPCQRKASVLIAALRISSLRQKSHLRGTGPRVTHTDEASSR